MNKIWKTGKNNKGMQTVNANNKGMQTVTVLNESMHHFLNICSKSLKK